MELEPRTEVDRELAKLDLDCRIEAELESMRAALPAAPEPMRALEKRAGPADENGRAVTPHT
jgi:hypothetical protein